MWQRLRMEVSDLICCSTHFSYVTWCAVRPACSPGMRQLQILWAPVNLQVRSMQSSYSNSQIFCFTVSFVWESSLKVQFVTRLVRPVHLLSQNPRDLKSREVHSVINHTVYVVWKNSNCYKHLLCHVHTHSWPLNPGLKKMKPVHVIISSPQHSKLVFTGVKLRLNYNIILWLNRSWEADESRAQRGK